MEPAWSGGGADGSGGKEGEVRGGRERGERQLRGRGYKPGRKRSASTSGLGLE
jgi:hypothetical protein